MPVFVFDAYGTLFNVHAAIGRYRDEAGPDSDRMSDLWRTKQLEYTWTLTLAGKYAEFWTLTERALDYALARFPSTNKALRQKFLDAYLSLDTYPDAYATLQAFKERGVRTAILSNGSPAMLAAAVKASKLESLVDAVLSVDTVKKFKPRPEVYQMTCDALKVAPGDVIMASSNRWDIMGASAFGYKPVWVNRTGMPDEYPEFPPVKVMPDLTSLITLA